MSAAEFAAGGTAEAGARAARAAAEFAELAAEYLDDLARRHPDTATSLGDHRFDDRLPDESGQALAAERRALDAFTARLAAIDSAAASAELRVDAAMLADGLARRIFQIDELRENTWNPLQANPGQAIYLLLARDFAPLPDRLAAVAGRLAQVPEALAAARRQLEGMPKVHLETAIVQFAGTIKLAGGEVDAALTVGPARSTRYARRRWKRWPRTATGFRRSSPRAAISPIPGSARSVSPASCPSR